MQKYFFLTFFILLVFSCKKVEREYTYENINFREEMRVFIASISDYAKKIDTTFLIIPQNGAQLITYKKNENKEIYQKYISAIDAQAQEGLFYGYIKNDFPTPLQTSKYLKTFLDKAKQKRKYILVTDYCISPDFVIDSYQKNTTSGYLSFVASSKELDEIPSDSIYYANANKITHLSQAKNFLYLLNSHHFQNKQAYIQAIKNTNYDILIMDLFFSDGTIFSSQDIQALKQKLNGGTRMIIAYISIGEAEDYRYYWQSQWNDDKPIWLDQENTEWHGNYKVKYWKKDWQKIIYGNDQSYLKKIIDAGFDGAYLDVVDAFEFFEQKNK